MSKAFLNNGLELYIKNHSQNDITEQIVEYATKTYKALNTRSASLSKLKRLIKDYLISKKIKIPPSVVAIQLPTEDYTQIFAQAKVQLDKRGDDPLHITDGEAFMNTMLTGIRSDNLGKLFVAIMLASGRRFSEIVKTASFTPVKNNPYAAIFTGQLKKSGPSEPYEIPLLVPYELFERAFLKFKNMIKGKTFHSASAGKYVKSISGIPTLKVHDLRRLYLAIAFHKTNSKQSLNRFAEKILGHEGAETSVAYTTTRVEGLNKTLWVPKLEIQDFQFNTPKQRKVCEDLIAYFTEHNKLPKVNELRAMGNSSSVITETRRLNKALVENRATKV